MSRKTAGVAPARTTVAAAGLLLAAGLAACGSGPTGTASSGTSFTYWTSQWQPAETAAVDKVFARAYPGMRAQGQYIASSALVAIVPVLAVAVAAQRHIVEGITLGALD